MDTFNWVKARAACNAEKLFDDLRKVVEADVDAANNHVNGRCFKFEAGPSHSEFRAVEIDRQRPLPPLDHRIFVLVDGTIQVKNIDSVCHLTARPYLASRDCQVEVDGRPMKLWEFSRLVLEPLFFHGL